MIGRILIRVVRAVATILIVATVVFLVVRLTGDPIRSVLPEGTPPEIEAIYRARWGLDRTLWDQYLIYLGGIFRGDFGQSYFDSDSALNVVLQRIPATLSLALPTFVISAGVGISMGIFAALSRGKVLDRFISSSSVIMSALPPFAVGIVLVLFFSVQLRWFPSAGNATVASFVLPIVCMAIIPTALFARMTRTSMVEALALPSVTHAKALGVTRRRRVFSYALPNAMLPVVTILGFEVAYLIAGSSVVEVLFTWPGIGRLFVQAAAQNDFAVVQCIVILVTTSVVTVFAITDVMYGVIDPRLRRSKS